ncbi:MAG: SHOCT domain-containing protein [Sulfurimonas sp.]|nr:SHOCT domain-containing protein [Sulfurimonas sp.]
MYDYGTHGYGMGLGWLIILLLIVLFVYFINGNKKEELSASDILDKRYANGEIDEKEYKTKKKNLEK